MNALKPILFLLSAIIILTLAVPASALSPFLQAQNATDMDPGYGLGLKRQFTIIPLIAIEARASWYYTDGGDSGADLNTFPLEAAGKLKFGFLNAGLGAGYYIYSGDFKPENSFGGFIFAGAEFQLFGLGAFAELRWLQLEPDFELGGNVDMSGVGANAGITIPIGK